MTVERRVEKASGSRHGPFPARWGLPRGEVDSEERAAWVRMNVGREAGGRVAVRLRNLRRIADLEKRRAP